MENLSFTIMELSSNFLQTSNFLLHKIVMEQLTPEPKAKHLESALTFLQRYHNNGEEFLDRIITGDKTWVAHITPRNQGAVNALASQSIFLEEEIQADFVGAKSDVHGVLGQMGHSLR